MKSPRMYENKLPEESYEALRLLYDQRKNEAFVLLVDGHGPVSAEILRRNFLKFGGLQRKGFGILVKHGVCIKATRLMRI